MSQHATPAPASRRPLMLALAGCGLLLLCALVVGSVAALFFIRRSAPVAGEPAVEYILDASPRMAAAGPEGGSRLSVAQGVLAEVVRPANPEVTAGLRVFGTGALPQACQDTDLVVPLAPANQAAISDRALAVSAGQSADAALAEAMIAAIRDLDATAGPHTLVVITGGADSCNAQAGQLVADEAERAGIELQSFVIGYQVPVEEAEAIRGLVDEAGNGTYLDAFDADELLAILTAIQKYVDDPTTTFPTVTLGTPAAVAVGPTSTAGAGATTAPDATPEPGTTAGPTAAGPEATPEPGATADTGGYVSQTACDNPYWPLRQGATWTYSMPEGTYTWTVVSVTGDQDAAEATMQFSMDGVTIDYHYVCTREGLVSYDYGNFSFAGEGGMTFNVNSSEGTWLPPADLLVPGYSWVNSYSLDATVDTGAGSMAVSSTVSENRTVGGFEPTTIEAGTFDTVRIESSGTYNSSVAGMPSVSFDTNSSTWFAHGIGMIRQTSTSSGASSTVTLVSYSIP